ncbi:Cysteine/Histidine-rich C1 domain family protein [Raphanus sativus]|uniref:Uncharacterized protein LOC108845370 n=1 Tax=Raphanus sativus TaxID=3726 RepID=A0A6J0MNM6_RAPSA|nr:uncharacterized protein LOC108845370 [Raphanus sativus]KAJ4907089.1 Cysteine/Histidine-rich C1 domain family protein [Raphanus sativus]
MDLEKKLVSIICLRVEAVVELTEDREGKIHLIKKVHGDPKENKCEADIKTFTKLLQAEGTSYVCCGKCYGNGHEEPYKNPPIKHPLHPKHNLMFAGCDGDVKARKCFCCEDPLEELFYCCPSCDFAINLACVVNKQPLFSIEHPKRHEHTVTLFPRQVTTSCNVCALDHSRCPIYICPSCDFVVHKRCIDLPWVIRISRHEHRIFFTPNFDLGDNGVCSICRKKINNDYGGYSCNKDGCSYVAHSRCATGKNVWDGKELEGEPEEEIEEELEPFMRLSDGIIRHFSHELHHLKLNEETVDTANYDEYKTCKACVLPIYYGNFYSCLDCDFILHETCANLSRRVYHAIHPHRLTLRMESPYLFSCSACSKVCSGFYYECSQGCHFMLHVQCATIYEPLIHTSHVHPLFLTSEPEEYRSCLICHDSGLRFGSGSSETFNCIECDFSLCFKCASLPQKVRYKHDEHILTLFYGDQEASQTNHNWCEICERKIKLGKRFYACDECCVTLHIKCLLGKDMHSSFRSYSSGPEKIDILPNNRMTRPICSTCHKRCQQKMVFQRYGSKQCSFTCMGRYSPS